MNEYRVEFTGNVMITIDSLSEAEEKVIDLLELALDLEPDSLEVEAFGGDSND